MNNWNQYSNPWKESEKKILINNFNALSLKEILKLLPNRTYDSIRTKAKRLNLPSKACLRWEEKDLNILKENYPHLNNIELNKILPNHSIFSIRSKLFKLGLKRSKEFRDSIIRNVGYLNRGRKKTKEQIDRQISTFKKNLSMGITTPSRLGKKLSYYSNFIRKEHRKKTLLENPKIMKLASIKRLKTINSNPSIIIAANKKRMLKRKLDPEKYHLAGLKASNTIKSNPIKYKERIDKIKNTLCNRYAKYKEVAYCMVCGKDFIISKRSNNNKKFCSIKCARKIQVFPKLDTSIEIKIQSFLKQLGITFFTHQYIKEIEHGYQCDILIPSMNLVIECDGEYWHKYPIGTDIDHIRTKELVENGFKVLRLWESEINNLNLDKFKEKLNNA